MNGEIQYRFGDFNLTLDITDELRNIEDIDSIGSDQKDQMEMALYARKMYLLFKASQQAAAWVKDSVTANGMTRLPGDEPAKAAPKVTNETLQVSKITHTFDKNAHWFKLWGGRFQKFGVPIYSDSSKGAEWVFSLPMGEHIMTDTVTALIELKDDKPTRATEVQREVRKQMDVPF